LKISTLIGDVAGFVTGCIAGFTSFY